ncbi:uncharacterized protein LOC124304481 [Neodiprion virginianus]|uniref:uncharacterized protein LOC124304481 n=1 Tax=Neodiprion virginianus TaxID=2961670 RepID=UPI001EE6AE32|nr:uncharacterized protein LOC124304481 [Neodiprion virginianus]
MQSCLYRKLFCYFVNRNNRITASLYHAKERSIDEYKEHGQRVENLHNTFLNYLQVNIMSKSNLKKYMMSLNIKTPERESFIASELRKNQLTPLDDIKQSPNSTSVTQTASKLLPILIIIDILDKEPNNAQFLFLLKRVDETCSRMLCDLSFDETLILLNELARTAPTKVMWLGFYLESIKTLRLRLSENKQSSLQIMNLLFLMSLRKTEALLDVRYTLKYLSDFEKLSIIEQCIVSIAAFKCGVKLDRQIIHIIEGTVQRNVEKLLKNQKLFVPLLKAMRHAGPSREFSLDHLSKRILEHKEKYKMSLAVPILALYAEILQADSKVINRLVGDAFLQMRKSGSISEDNIAAEDAIRVKDIDRLLWAVSTLNHKLTHSQLLYVEKFLSDNLDAFSRYPKAFCGSLLALWILGSKCRQIIEYCFRVQIFHPLLQNSLEDSGRLVVLLACIKIEAPTVVIPSNLIWDPNKKPLLNEYSELECISSILKCLESQLELSEINVDCPVNEIRIYGISAKHETLGWLHVDLLNNYTCLCKPRKPHGLMNLKLRLIKTLGYTSILVNNIGPLKVEKVVTTIGEAIDELMRK